MTRPFADVRILDFTCVLAGPFPTKFGCTQPDQFEYP